MIRVFLLEVSGLPVVLPFLLQHDDSEETHEKPPETFNEDLHQNSVVQKTLALACYADQGQAFLSKDG